MSQICESCVMIYKFKKILQVIITIPYNFFNIKLAASLYYVTYLNPAAQIYYTKTVIIKKN